MNKVLDGVIGGWQASGILSLHTGFPLTVTAADASGTLSRGARGDCIAPADVFRAMNSPVGGYQWFNRNHAGTVGEFAGSAQPAVFAEVSLLSGHWSGCRGARVTPGRSVAGERVETAVPG